jgi:hypothetical protein
MAARPHSWAGESVRSHALDEALAIGVGNCLDRGCASRGFTSTRCTWVPTVLGLMRRRSELFMKGHSRTRYKPELVT